MDYLSVPSRANSAKAKALEAGRKMQNRIIEAANRENQTPPKYALSELIGKGSFGLVYKGQNVTTAEIVAVKIIDIDESDLANPRYADSYGEFLKEVGALKQLRESKARNINHVIDALAVGTTLWLITEFCGGGSVATLMKPTVPGGLDEKWIIPILRETAEAIKWVHAAGIIHRDIKCANILVTEQGDVKLCDFGVAGTIESSLQKRSTFTGTPHWMAPELFGNNRSYGKEVDIWAFGAMIHEIATGLPPNVQSGISYLNLGAHLRSNTPTLEGNNFSTELRNLAACCLEIRPEQRPPVKDILQHPYLYNSELVYPTSSLSELVKAYNIWERQGNGRQSLITGGASPSQGQKGASQEWNFTATTTTSDKSLPSKNLEQSLPKPKNVNLKITIPPISGSLKHMPFPAQSQNELHSHSLSAVQSPLEQAFDPTITSNYEENSQRYYSPSPPSPVFGSAIPLQETQTSSQGSLIDLGDFDAGDMLVPSLEGLGINLNLDQQSMLASERDTDNTVPTDRQITQSTISRKENKSDRYRSTNDWRQPTAEEQSELASPGDSTDEEIFHLLPTPESPSGDRPALKHYPTDPTSMQPRGENAWLSNRESLIDLDLAVQVMPVPYSAVLYHDRSSADSDIPVRLKPEVQEDTKEPLPNNDSHPKLSDPHLQQTPHELPRQLPHNTLPHRPLSVHPQFASHVSLESPHPQDVPHDFPSTFIFPDLPDAPSHEALLGQLSPHETAKEVSRMFDGLQEQLMAFQNVYHSVAEGMRKREEEKSDEEEK